MLHDHLVQSNSGDPSLATPYHQHHAVRARRTLHHHQLDDDQYVNRVGLMTWTDPCYDVINPQCAYSQHSASSSIRVCGHRPPAARVTPVTSAQWPYTAGHLQPTTDWTSPLPAAVATSTLWNSTHSLPDDRVFTYNTIPHSSSAVQFGSHYSSTDSVMPCWRLDGTEPSSPEMTTNSSTLTPINSKLDVFMTSTHNRQSHHQLTHMSTPAYYPPCNVSSSSDDTQVLDDNTKHQFGAKPTRASTSIGKTRTREKYRTVYNERQKVQLEEQYVANTYISAEQKADIARDVGLSERQVKIWFQNRRAKDRRQKYQSCDQDGSDALQQQLLDHHQQQCGGVQV